MLQALSRYSFSGRVESTPCDLESTVFISPLFQDLKYILFQVLPGEVHPLISKIHLFQPVWFWSENDPALLIKIANLLLSSTMSSISIFRCGRLKLELAFSGT